jgi:hypothetical protein
MPRCPQFTPFRQTKGYDCIDGHVNVNANGGGGRGGGDATDRS